MPGIQDIQQALQGAQRLAALAKIAAAIKGTRQQAASTQGMGNAQRSYFSGGGGGAPAPIAASTLPDTPQVKDLVAKGLLKEGMPPEQVQAIIAIQGLAGQVPIDIKKLMAEVTGNYEKYTGDITTSGADWMKDILGGMTPDDPAMAALFAQDPALQQYSSGLAQIDETADSNLATDLAWFTKAQQADTEYYNQLMQSVSAMPPAEPVLGGGGGGGGGGGRHYGGGGYGGGGNGSGGDGVWTDPRTRLDYQDQVRNTADANMSAQYPEFFDKLMRGVTSLDQPVNPEATSGYQSWIHDLFYGGEGDPQSVGERLLESVTGNQSMLDAAAQTGENNAAWLAALPENLRQEMTAWMAQTGNTLGDNPDTPETEAFYVPEDFEPPQNVLLTPELLAQQQGTETLANQLYNPEVQYPGQAQGVANITNILTAIRNRVMEGRGQTDSPPPTGNQGVDDVMTLVANLQAQGQGSSEEYNPLSNLPNPNLVPSAGASPVVRPQSDMSYDEGVWTDPLTHEVIGTSQTEDSPILRPQREIFGPADWPMDEGQTNTYTPNPSESTPVGNLDSERERIRQLVASVVTGANRPTIDTNLMSTGSAPWQVGLPALPQTPGHQVEEAQNPQYANRQEWEAAQNSSGGLVGPPAPGVSYDENGNPILDDAVNGFRGLGAVQKVLANRLNPGRVPPDEPTPDYFTPEDILAQLPEDAQGSELQTAYDRLTALGITGTDANQAIRNDQSGLAYTPSYLVHPEQDPRNSRGTQWTGAGPSDPANMADSYGMYPEQIDDLIRNTQLVAGMRQPQQGGETPPINPDILKGLAAVRNAASAAQTMGGAMGTDSFELQRALAQGPLTEEEQVTSEPEIYQEYGNMAINPQYEEQPGGWGASNAELNPGIRPDTIEWLKERSRQQLEAQMQGLDLTQEERDTYDPGSTFYQEPTPEEDIQQMQNELNYSEIAQRVIDAANPAVTMANYRDTLKTAAQQTDRVSGQSTSYDPTVGAAIALPDPDTVPLESFDLSGGGDYGFRGGPSTTNNLIADAIQQRFQELNPPTPAPNPIQQMAQAATGAQRVAQAAQGAQVAPQISQIQRMAQAAAGVRRLRDILQAFR